jgi:hypothetical protein
MKNKTTRHRPYGTLLSIDPPYNQIPKAFESINIDLIVGLPRSGGYNAVPTAVDRHPLDRSTMGTKVAQITSRDTSENNTPKQK